MRKILIFVLISIILVSCSNNSLYNKKADGIKRILILNVNVAPNLKEEISQNKVLSGLNLACELSKNLEMVPIQLRDSIYQLFNKENRKLNVFEIGKYFNADYLGFIGINSIQNIMRTDVTLVNVLDSSIKQSGFGYSNIRFRAEKSDKIIYDPSLLNSSQKALCMALKDSSLYENAKEGFNIKPTKPLAIGGIYYINNDKLKDWELFLNKEISSYDAVQTVFESAKNSNEYTVFDIETRDEIYKLENLMLVENFNAITEVELLALNRIGVDYLVNGVLKRTDEGAELNLVLYKLTATEMIQLKYVSDVLISDSITEYRGLLRKLTKELLGLKKD